jgi:hypothetical protein
MARSWRDRPRTLQNLHIQPRRHGAPLQLHVFLVFYNDFLFSHSRHHAFCMVFYPCILLLQCVLTRKTCHALSSLGVVIQMILIALIMTFVILMLLLGLIRWAFRPWACWSTTHASLHKPQSPCSMSMFHFS